MKEIQEAEHPGMSGPVRGKLAKNLVRDRKEIKATKDPKQKEYLRNLSKFNATTYNPEKTKQVDNKTTPIAKKNTDAYKENSKKPGEDKMFKKNFMTMNESDSSFKGRVLQEDVYNNMQGPGLGSSLSDNLKNNWGKYALGAGAGALGMAANHVMGDDNDGGILDEYKDAYQAGNLKDTIVGDVQSGMGNLKLGGDSAPTNDYHQTDAPDVSKLKGALETGTGKSMTNLDKLNSIAYQHRDVDADILGPSYSTGMFGGVDPNVTDADIERHEMNQIHDTYSNAMKDGNMDTAEAAKIQELLNNRSSEQWFGQSDAADELQLQREQETQLGIDTAKRLGHEVLLSGDDEARDQFFNDMNKRMGGIPKEYMGLYKDHLRYMDQR